MEIKILNWQRYEQITKGPTQHIKEGSIKIANRK
jgi:hypothetical protein